MEIKHTKSFLSKLEDLVTESNYILRYEKGNFKSGYCILNDSSIVIINKYYSLEGKINCLIDIIQNITIEPKNLSEKSKELHAQITQTSLNI